MTNIFALGPQRKPGGKKNIAPRDLLASETRGTP
jgi:hypothetical protein